MTNDLTCVELFAGAGGASLGLHRAGFTSLLAAEWEPDACEAHRQANFGPVWEGDVREIDSELDLKKPPTLLWASPPCQAFSSAGRRLGAPDERNGWPWTLDIIDKMEAKGVKPTWVICENVPGLTFHRADCPRDEEEDPTDCPGCYWERWIIPEFTKRYAWCDTGMLDAADFGVPQRRRRIFVIAGPQPLEWPTGTHSYEALLYDKWVTRKYWERHHLQPPKRGPNVTESKDIGVKLLNQGPDEGVKPWRTVRDALGLGFPIRHQSPSCFPIQHLPDETAPAVSIKGTLYAESEVQEDPAYNPHYREGRQTRFIERNSGQRGPTERSVDQPSPTVQGGSCQGSFDRLQVEDVQLVEQGLRRKQGVDEPAPTLRAGGQEDHAGKMAGGKPHYLEGDILTHPEAEFASQGTEDPKHPSKSVDEPATGIRAGGDGHSPPNYWVQTPEDVVLHRQRGASTPGKPRRDHPIDEPSPTVDAGAARCGSALEWKVAKGTQDATPDDPAPTVRAGGNVDASGKLGGGAPPYLTAPTKDEDTGDNVFSMFGEKDEEEQETMGGHPVTRSRTGRPRIEYTLKKAPENPRGPSDLVRRHEVTEPDLPSTSIRTGKPEYANSGSTQPELVDTPSRAVSATEAKGCSAIPQKRNRALDDLFLSTGHRPLTVEECAILQGFPEGYPFSGTSTSKYRQVGNAVAPPVAEALGRAIRDVEES